MFHLRPIQILLAAIVLLSFAAGFYYYPSLPPMVATHFNYLGVPDGFSSRLMGAFFFPVVILLVALLLTAIPYIRAPFRENISSFISYYDFFSCALAAFLFMVYFQVLQFNSGVPIDLTVSIPAGLGGLIFFVGLMCEKSSRNWFIGIRTPWTISSDENWRKTNTAGGKSFQVVGVIGVLMAFIASNSLTFVVSSIIFVAIFSVLYSYLEFTRSDKLAGRRTSKKARAKPKLKKKKKSTRR